jgi:hypothetical protein
MTKKSTAKRPKYADTNIPSWVQKMLREGCRDALWYWLGYQCQRSGRTPLIAVGPKTSRTALCQALVWAWDGVTEPEEPKL